MVILSMSGIKTSISTFRYFKAYGFQCLRNYCHEALLSVLFFCTASFVCNKASAGVVSPNGRIVVEVQGDTSLAVKYIDGKSVCRAFTIPSLGVAVDGNSESGRWRVASMKSSRPLHECYTMQTGKRSECVNEGIEYIYACSYGTDGHGRLALRLYDDGIAFRYEIDGWLAALSTMSLRHTAYQRAWNDTYSVSTLHTRTSFLRPHLAGRVPPIPLTLLYCGLLPNAGR